jgi:hypothetical protein
MARPLKHIVGKRRDELLLSLAELSDACPVHHLNPEDCPLYPLRRLELKKRQRWLKSLSEDDLGYLATYHHVCLKLKVESQTAVHGVAGVGG